MVYVYLNGEVLPHHAASLPVDDRAILFGDAAYETVRSYAGRYFRLSQHLDRLRSTATAMGMDVPYSDAEIARGAAELLDRNGLRDARLRLTLTGGRHEGAIRLARPHAPNLIMSVFPLTLPPETLYATGVDVMVSRWTVHTDSPLPRIKTVNRLMHLMAKEEAIEAGAYESLFPDEAGNLLEGTATNVFFVLAGVLVTPALGNPILAGVTREAILAEAHAGGLECRETTVSLETALAASEAFLSASTIELLPIRTLAGSRIGDGRPGPVWHNLRGCYRALVAHEVGSEPTDPES